MGKITILIALCVIIAVSTMNKANAEDTIGMFTYGKYQRTVSPLVGWQEKISNKLGIPKKTQLYLKTIQNQECGDENGFCVTKSDCGPFQINNIHPVEAKWCRKMVAEGKHEIVKAKKTNDWSKVIKIRDELYESQVMWTWGRMKAQVKQFDIPSERVERIRQLCIYHNGSDHRQDYGNRCVITYKILVAYHGLK